MRSRRSCFVALDLLSPTRSTHVLTYIWRCVGTPRQEAQRSSWTASCCSSRHRPSSLRRAVLLHLSDVMMLPLVVAESTNGVQLHPALTRSCARTKHAPAERRYSARRAVEMAEGHALALAPLGRHGASVRRLDDVDSISAALDSTTTVAIVLVSSPVCLLSFGRRSLAFAPRRRRARYPACCVLCACRSLFVCRPLFVCVCAFWRCTTAIFVRGFARFWASFSLGRVLQAGTSPGRVFWASTFSAGGYLEGCSATWQREGWKRAYVLHFSHRSQPQALRTRATRRTRARCGRHDRRERLAEQHALARGKRLGDARPRVTALEHEHERDWWRRRRRQQDCGVGRLFGRRAVGGARARDRERLLGELGEAVRGALCAGAERIRAQRVEASRNVD